MTKAANAGRVGTEVSGRGKPATRAAAPRAAGAGRTAKAAGRGAPRVPLSKERILAAAFRLVEERGLAGLTARRLGEVLGCEAMSVYHHFPNKQHLFDAMVEQAVAGVREPPANLDPIEQLRFLGHEYRAMAYRYPRFFPLVALHRLNMPGGAAFIERMLRHFHAAIPDDRLSAQAFRIFGDYVIGAALDGTSGYTAGPSAAEPVTDEYIARECPRLAAAAPYFKPPYFESTFDLGFEIMLDGITGLRATLPTEPRGAPKPVIHLKPSGHAP